MQQAQAQAQEQLKDIEMTDEQTAEAIANAKFDRNGLFASIKESGLESEFDIDADVQIKLAADVMLICSIAFQAMSDEKFESAIANLTPVQSPDEAAFLFGFMQHVQSAVMQEMSEFLEAEGMKDVFLSRLRRARDLRGFVQ